MKAIHYWKHHKIACGSKAKANLIAFTGKKVTCKNCRNSRIFKETMNVK